MKHHISSTEFEKMTNSARKRYVVSLLIQEANSMPVEPPSLPIAIVMAGLPGAGKTEFLDSFEEAAKKAGQFNPFVRVDLDQIVTIYPNYTPQTYNKFRGQGNTLLARCIDVLRKQRHNMMIDGTFSGPSGSSIKNVAKLLEKGYFVFLVYMHDEAETAWRYTQLREIETDRGIDKEGFLASCVNISTNLKKALEQFDDNPNFSTMLVKQKRLRDKNYEIIIERTDIDSVVNEGYNIDKLKEIL